MKQPLRNGCFAATLMALCFPAHATSPLGRSDAALTVSASTVPQAVAVNTSAVAASALTRYLLFQIFTYTGMPDATTAFAPIVADIIQSVGTTGGNGRKLGFAVGPLALDYSNAELVEIIDECFAVAEKYDVAVMFHFDDSMFWKNRRDLWSQHQNIEWTSWSGTPSGPRVLPWYTAATLAPQMCYNSPDIEQAIAELVQQTLGPAIQKNVAALQAQGKADLFAGVIMGWETQLPDTDPPIGYCALTNLGYSASNPPTDPNTTLVGVVYQFIEFWDQQFIAAGISPDKLFTHIAVPSPGADNNHAPVAVAFNPLSHAGFSVYGTHLQIFPQIYAALATQSDRQWGVSEGSNLYPPNALPGGTGKPDEAMGRFLAQAYNHGAVYANLFGWTSNGTAFRSALTDPTAIAAYRSFLQGGPLPLR